MLKKFVLLLTKEITEEREKLVRILSEQMNMQPAQREAYVGRNLGLKWVEDQIQSLYRADESDLGGDELPDEQPETPKPTARKPTSQRRASTWE